MADESKVTVETDDAKKLSESYLVSRAESLFTSSKNFREEEREDRWVKDNDAYNSRFSDDQKKNSELLALGKLFIPKTYSHTQRILVDILDAYFFDKEEILDVTSWKSVPFITRDIMKAVLNYRLNGHPVDFYQEAYDASLDALKNSVGIMKVFPKFFPMEIEGKMSLKYCPQVETLPYEDVFFYSRATWKNYHKHPQVHRFVKSRDWALRRGYINMDKISAVGTHHAESTDVIKQQRSDYTGSPFTDQSTLRVKNLEEITFYEVWDFLDVNNTGRLVSCSYVMAGDGVPAVLARDVKENKLPFQTLGEDYNRSPIVCGNGMPESHELYGKTIPQIVDGLQRETNSQRNQDREIVAMNIRRPTLIAKSAGVDIASMLRRRTGGIVMGDDISPQSIREMEVAPPPQYSALQGERTSQDFFETTSVPPDLQGGTSLREDTATGVNSRVANASKKINHIIRNLTHTLFLPVFRMMMRMEQEYGDDQFIALVTGRVLGLGFMKDGTPPTAYIQGDFDLTVNTGLNKGTQFNRLVQMMDVANQANQSMGILVQTGVVDPKNVKFKNTMAMFDRMPPLLGEKNIEELNIPAQAPPQEEGGGGDVVGTASQPRREGANTNPAVQEGNA